jgi:hypothetical protein
MISNGVDHSGLLLLMYPRPVMVASAVLDFFPIEGARKSFREAQRLYERLDHPERIAMTEGYHGHQFSDENQEAALDFLDRFNGIPVRHGLAAPRELPDKDLLCTHSGQIMVDRSDARSLVEIVRDYYHERKALPALSLPEEYYKGQPKSVEEWIVTEFQNAPAPGEGRTSWEFVGSTKFGDVLIDKYMLRHSRLLEMPLLYIHKPSTERRDILIWFSEKGKATPGDWPEIERFLQSGYSLVSFDFRGLGETRMSYAALSSDDPTLGKLDFDHAYMNAICGVLANHVYNSLVTGRPYFFQMIEDAEIAKRFARERLGATAFAVTSPGDGYTLASAITETFPDVKLLPQPNAPVLKWSDLVEEKQEIWPIQYLVPGGAHIH